MKVILVQDVKGLGEEGETREVARGYARNFLFPKGFAVEESSFNRNRMKEQRKKIELRKVKKREEAQQLADTLSNLSINIPAAVGKNEKLFGAIHEQDIIKVLDDQGASGINSTPGIFFNPKTYLAAISFLILMNSSTCSIWATPIAAKIFTSL